MKNNKNATDAEKIFIECDIRSETGIQDIYIISTTD